MLFFRQIMRSISKTRKGSLFSTQPMKRCCTPRIDAVPPTPTFIASDLRTISSDSDECERRANYPEERKGRTDAAPTLPFGFVFSPQFSPDTFFLKLKFPLFFLIEKLG